MANLIPWSPFRELADIENIFDRFCGQDLLGRKPVLKVLGEGSWSPAIDVYDKKDRLVLKAELPGMEKKDVSVKVDGDVLIIKGETRKEEETKEKDHYYSERIYGSFSRAVPLPVAVQKEKVKASYRDGVLTVDLPKSKEAVSKEIDIQVQ